MAVLLRSIRFLAYFVWLQCLFTFLIFTLFYLGDRDMVLDINKPSIILAVTQSVMGILIAIFFTQKFRLNAQVIASLKVRTSMRSVCSWVIYSLSGTLFVIANIIFFSERFCVITWVSQIYCSRSLATSYHFPGAT